MKKGFTFIELILLVLCVSTLAALAVPEGTKQSELFETATCRKNMMTLAIAESMYFCKFNVYASLANLEYYGILNNATSLECPTAAGVNYVPTTIVGDDFYTIHCPCGPLHGYIATDFPSWY